MADPFSSLINDGVTNLTRAALVQALFTALQSAPSGSAAQPGIAFLSDPTSGLYLYADGTAIGLVFKGIEQITITKTGVVFSQPATGLISAEEVSTPIKNAGPLYTLNFSPLGSATFVITPNANMTLALNTGSVQPGIRQVLNVLIRQPTTGGFAVTISMPDVAFLKNAADVPILPTVSMAAGDKTPLQFISWGDPDGTIEGA